jgi:Aspartyl protease/Tetratricopeptide repeat
MRNTTLFILFITSIIQLNAQVQPDTLFRRGEFSKVKAALHQNYDQQDFNSNKLLGRIALLENQFETATQYLRHAIALKPADTAVNLLMAETYYRQDKFAEAIPFLIKGGRTAKAKQLETFAGQQPYQVNAEKIQIKFEQTDPLPLIKVRVHDEDLYFLLDTGGPEIIVDEDWAKKNNLPDFGSESGTFAGGKKAPVSLSRLDKITIGGATVSNIPVRLLKTSQYAAIGGGRAVSGVIGTVFLYHFLATIDYPAGKLILEKPTLNTKKSKQAIPFWMAGSHFMVAWGSINKVDTTLLFIDTGLAAVGIGFTGPLATIKKANATSLGGPIEGVGGGGKVTVTPILLSELAMGDIVKTNFPGLLGAFPATLEYGHGFRIGGLVSHSFFRERRITFDFKKMIVSF